MNGRSVCWNTHLLMGSDCRVLQEHLPFAGLTQEPRVDLMRERERGKERDKGQRRNRKERRGRRV